jgi:NTE family protein
VKAGGVLVSIFLAAVLAGCASPAFNKASNAPWREGAPSVGFGGDLIRGNSIVLAFSGGGLRASAFTLGTLQALESVKTADGDLLDDVAIISSVSGSSLASAYFGLYGREGLGRFREEVLLPGFESGMRLSLFSPANIGRLLRGGLNLKEDFGDVLDDKVFHGATFADLYRHPRPSIRIHATDLYHRIPFQFISPLFDVLCSDLSSYHVADAVAASMAVPLVFAPIVVRTYPGHCPPMPREADQLRAMAGTSQTLAAISRAVAEYRDERVRYIKLGDGGLTDNYAVSMMTNERVILGTPYAPLTARDAVQVRRLLLIVVDASRGPGGDWLDREDGPGGIDLALSATDAAVDSAARQAADAFDNMIEGWRRSVVEFRCSLSREQATSLGAHTAWNCGDVKFTVSHLSIHDLESPYRQRIQAIPTRLTLDAAQIDDTIEGARHGLLALPGLQQYVRERAPLH